MSAVKVLVSLAASAALCCATAARAASVLGETFQLDAVVDSVQADAPATGVAGSGDDPYGAPDASVTVFPTDFKVWWVDGDSFDLQIIRNENAFDVVDLPTATVTLSGLHFNGPGGQPLAITAAAFNEAASPAFDGYFQSADNPSAPPRIQDPTLEVTGQSVAVSFADYSHFSVGDQLIMRFDVQTAPVPEASRAALLLCGLGALAGARRGRMRRG